MATTIDTTCAIAGGGPAGMMLGLLLARAGVDVVVLEKHRDFLRDFRGDTVHPSTLEVMHELGVLAEFLRRPHQKALTLSAVIGGETVHLADFRHLPTRCGYIVMMPQWDFLDFLADHARRYRGFALRMGAEVTELIEEDGRIVGVRADARGALGSPSAAHGRWRFRMPWRRPIYWRSLCASAASRSIICGRSNGAACCRRA